MTLLPTGARPRSPPGANRAGDSGGTIYDHFKDRDALLKDFVVARREERLARLDAVLASTEKDGFGSQLEQLVRAVLEHFDADKAFLAIILGSEHMRAQEL